MSQYADLVAALDRNSEEISSLREALIKTVWKVAPCADLKTDEDPMPETVRALQDKAGAEEVDFSDLEESETPPTLADVKEALVSLGPQLGQTILATHGKRKLSELEIHEYQLVINECRAWLAKQRGK
jgi:hypothetical protein